MNKRILIVSDGALDASVRHALDDHGFETTIVGNAGDGYWRLTQSHFDLVVVNLARSSDGVSLVKRIRSSESLKRRLILMIADWGTGEATIALAAGADGFEPAPIDGDRLVAVVERLLPANLVMSAKMHPQIRRS